MDAKAKPLGMASIELERGDLKLTLGRSELAELNTLIAHISTKH